MADAFDWGAYPTAQAAAAPAPAPEVAAAAPAPAASPFDWNEHPIVPAEPGALEATARGAVQGATLGFGDEATGGAQALYDKLTGNAKGKTLSDLYSQHTGEARAANEASQAAHPYLYGAGNVAGSLASGLATGGLGAETALGRVGVGAGMGALAGVGYGNANNINDGAAQALEGAVAGGAVGTAVEGLSSALNPSSLRAGAEAAATNATGATGLQASRFAPGAGRELLDRGIVGFGDTPESIAQKASGEMASSGKDIGEPLAQLDAAGAKPITKDTVLKYIKDKINDLSTNPAEAGTVKQLDSIADAVDKGPESYSLTEAENIKKSFASKVNYNTPDSNPANREAADVFRSLVEDKATEANPELAATFKQGKEDYGLMAPIQEAAQRRAATTAQSPVGGLLDVASIAGGMATGHPLLAAAAPIARKFAAPRIASTVAVGMDKLADIVQSAPHLLGPWAQQLSAAASRSSIALSATNSILQQTSPEYREHMNKLTESK